MDDALGAGGTDDGWISVRDGTRERASFESGGIQCLASLFHDNGTSLDESNDNIQE